jgi:hypothetical protein
VKKKFAKTLRLSRETLRGISHDGMSRAAGGMLSVARRACVQESAYTNCVGEGGCGPTKPYTICGCSEKCTDTCMACEIWSAADC